MRYYMFNKPRGCISACSDARVKTVIDYVHPEEREGLFPIGRLDKDTEGFLILTDDGKLCFHINEPAHKVPKTYFFWARGNVDEEKIKALESGVNIYKEKDRLTAPAKAEIVSVSCFRDIAHLLDDENPARLIHTRRGDIPVTGIKITITEGKKHQVKRMARAIGMYIVYLERIAIAGVPLDPNLPRGAYRPLKSEELSALAKDYFAQEN